MSYHRRNRLRKGRRGITSSYSYNPRAAYHPIFNKHRRSTPEWGALHKSWVRYVIAKSQDDYEKMRKYAKSQDDYEKMRKYAIVIRKFERQLNIAMSDFPEIGVYGFKEDFENKEEDDDSKHEVYDPWSNERIEDAKEDEDEDEDRKDEDYDRYYRSLYSR
jgi:hypothetical protein